MSDAARPLFRRATATRTGRQATNTRPQKASSSPASSASTSSRRSASAVPSQPRRTNVYPPVVTRQGTDNTTPLSRRATTPARRQYYYALSTPGAEVRLPALPALHPSWRMLSGALVLVLAFCLFALWNAPTFQIGDISLIGAQRLTKVDLEAVLNVAGEPSVTISPSFLENELLEAFPDLSSANVVLSFPASLSVEVTERQPVIAWEQDGKTSWIDMEGYSFPTRGEPGVQLVTIQAEGSPPILAKPEDDIAVTDGAVKADKSTAETTLANLLTPAKAVPFLPQEMIVPLAEMAAKAPAGMPLAYSPDYGLGWTDPGGWKVYFGHDTTNIELKLSEYQAIVDYLVPRNVHPSLISVEYLHAPFYRLEP